MIDEALRSLLIADGTVNGLVGSRIYPLIAPRTATLPLVIFQRISAVRDASHTSTSGAGLVEATYQFAGLAPTYSAAKTLTEAVRDALDQYRGTSEGVSIDAIHAESDFDGYNEPPDVAERSFARYQQMTVWYLE